MDVDERSGGKGRPSQQTLLPTDLSGFAVFLDVDGTLLDLAPTPDAIVVQPGLPDRLVALRDRLEGALALVTGRPVALVESLFPGLDAAIAGLHGAEFRLPGGTTGEMATTPAYLRSRERLRSVLTNWPGVVFEDKGAAFAAHYRLAPEREKDVRILMQQLADETRGWTLQHGKCVVELRPAGSDKGAAVSRLMSMDPFAERIPLAIGDDVTDEAMFDLVNGLGGISVRVGTDDKATVARYRLAAPQSVRDWIEMVTA